MGQSSKLKAVYWLNQITVGVSEWPAVAEMGEISKSGVGMLEIQLTFGVSEQPAVSMLKVRLSSRL